jgi:DNA polymerase III delta subunit
MLNSAFRKEIEKGLPGFLYYVWSEEGCFLDDALARVTEVITEPGSADFNLDIFDSSSGSQPIIDAASTLPFMTMRRLVVIRDFHQIPAAAVKQLIDFFRKPVESTCLVVLSQKAPKAAWKTDWKVFSLNIRESDIPAAIKHFGAGKGITLTDDAVGHLIELVGNDIGLLFMEVEKLALSGHKTITGKDVAASTSMMRQFTSFDLIDALIAGQKTRVFRILKTVFERNAMEAPVLLGTLNWHYKQFYTLWLNKGKRPLKMREKTFRALVKYLSAFRENDFYQIFRNLHEADVAIKTSGRPGLSLEVLMIKLLQKGRAH